MIVAIDRYIYKKSEMIHALYGSVFITICSLISIPTRQISMTLQTLAIFILALMQSPGVCCGSLLFYLLEAGLGLPVFCGLSNPLWFLGYSAGYLFAFPIAGYLTARLAQKSSSVRGQVFAMLCGLFLIYFGGFI